MKMSMLYAPTLREAPNEAELISHQLLLRAGMIRMLSSGIYSYLPLGIKVLKKIEMIVREAMHDIDSQEVLLSTLFPSELLQESASWENIDQDMFKLKGGQDREYCLSAMHHQAAVQLVRHEVKSYKQLPLSFYQIQTKLIDEKRPRLGLIHSRELFAKDAYTFDRDNDSAQMTQQKVWSAYQKIFERCGLNYKTVASDSVGMESSASHQWIALSEKGENAFFYCDSCDYAVTAETAKVTYSIHDKAEFLAPKKVLTPGVKTIAQLSEFLNVKADQLAKMVIYSAGEETVAVLIPGNREINTIKLINHLGIGEDALAMASADIVKQVTHAETGFAGPIGLSDNVRLIADKRITQMRNFTVGGNETDVHIINVNYGRDFEAEIVDDLLWMIEGDCCPKCGASVTKDSGYLVGHTSQLAADYGNLMGATYLDENGKDKPLIMGAHSIFISRMMSLIIEQNCDENGIIWPMSVAPYHVVIIVANSKKEDQQKLGFALYDTLKDRGIEVLIDDRKERFGVKFNDAELIGIPMVVVVGKNAADGIVEFKDRKIGEKLEMSIEDVIELVMNRQ